MVFKAINIPGAYLIKLSPYSDERGVFSRLFCEREFEQIGFKKNIVQINHSLNVQKGTLRGMHFQHPPNAEEKIIKSVHGTVYDVMIDLREGSPTFLHQFSVELSPGAYNAIYIPEGCAHGFQTLENNCELLYFHTQFYNKSSEGGIRYNDPVINIQWPLEVQNITDKDKNYPLLTTSFKGVMPYFPIT